MTITAGKNIHIRTYISRPFSRATHFHFRNDILDDNRDGNRDANPDADANLEDNRDGRIDETPTTTMDADHTQIEDATAILLQVNNIYII